MNMLKRLKLAFYVYRNAQDVSDSLELASSTGYAIDVELMARGATETQCGDLLVSCGHGGCSYGTTYGKRVAKISQNISADIKRIK